MKSLPTMPTGETSGDFYESNKRKLEQFSVYPIWNPYKVFCQQG